MNSIQLSILIATLNSEAFISDCLNSILLHLASSSHTFEIVIKDGGSTDTTESIVKSFQEKLPIKFISGPDTGIYNAMNHEIEAASGEWLYFMGSDDIILPGMIKLLEIAETGQYDLIYGDAHLKHENRLYDGEFDLKMLFQAPPPHQASIFRTSLFEKYGNYNEEYFICSDYDRFLLFFSRPELKIRYVNATAAIFNDDGFSRSGPKDNAFARDRHKLINQYYDTNKFDKDLKQVVHNTKRKDAIMVIDLGINKIVGYGMYLSTIRLSDNHIANFRYLFGSLVKHIKNW